MTNLSTNLVVSARNHPDKTALRCGQDTLSFAEFDAAAARVATLLERAGIGPGDRVAVMLPNTAAFAIVFYGILRRGAIAVPMNPLLKAREIEYFLTNTAAAALFATPMFAEAARAAADAAAARLWLVDDDDLARLIADLPAQPVPVARAGGDTAVILHTSGTTGKPKGAELTHAGLAGNAEVTARTLIQIGPDDVVMGALPLFHVFGLTCGLNTSVAVGATLTLVPRFDPRTALEVIARDKVSVFLGVPTMYAAMLGVADGIRRGGHGEPAGVRVRRRVAAGGGAHRLRADLRRGDPGRIRAVGNLAGRLVQPPEPHPQARLDRHPDRGGADARGRRRRCRGRGRASPARSRSRDRT